MLYVMLMDNVKPLNEDVVLRHVAHLRALDTAGKLFVCGPFADYSGGMVIFRAESLAEAEALSQADPFIADGYKTFQLRTLEVAHGDNGYLLG